MSLLAQCLTLHILQLLILDYADWTIGYLFGLESIWSIVYNIQSNVWFGTFLNMSMIQVERQSD